MSGTKNVSLTEKLRPHQPALAGFVHVFTQLNTTLDETRPGVLTDLDPEDLHDFRIAVRRTRAILGVAKRVLPGQVRDGFRSGFAALGVLTSPVRDLDVYLLGWPADVEELAVTTQVALDPVLDQLRADRVVALAELRAGLESLESVGLLTAWSEWLAAPKGCTRSPDAKRPLGRIAADRLDVVHHELVRCGRAITAESPAEDLHQLRKDAKKLRYLLECFGGLPGRASQHAIVKQLKELQDNLGTHQDADVHARMLLDLGRTTGLSKRPKIRAALRELAHHFEQRERDARSEFTDRFERFDSKQTRRHLAELQQRWRA